MNFNDEFSIKIKYIEEWLADYLTNKNKAPQLIFDAMKYSVDAGGKRIRPVMMLAAFEMFSDKKEKVAPFCAAIEMIHTYSLIHDDLPAMDDSDLRRGKATNHKIYGEAMAILAGDALLNFAFETMLNINSEADALHALKTAKYISDCSGVYGMVGGQVIDIDSENKKIDIETLKTLQLKKTGALISAAVCGGAILAGANAEDVKKLEEYSYLVGLAFQIKDDILDATGDVLTLGKPIGGDAENNKNTYVSLLGIEESKKLLNDYTVKAKNILLDFGSKAEFLLNMTNYLLERKK